MNPAAPAGAAGGPPSDVPTLYTLSEVAEATGIPLAELDRYRRRHGDRVPSIVLGETRRYPAEALAVFRDLHREREASGAAALGGRRLMSLTAQRRTRQPERDARERTANGASAWGHAPGTAGVENAGADRGVATGTAGVETAAGADRGAASRTAGGETARAAAGETAATNGATHGTSPPAATSAAPPVRSPLTPSTPSAPRGSGAVAREAWAGETRGAETRRGVGAVGEDPTAGLAAETAGDEDEVVEVLARSGNEPVPPPSRPARPLYTLQQVHEHTGIPYPTLALYAAAHADRVPAVGERYAKLYPWEAMAAFARVHAEMTPGWSPPELAPPESVVAWRRDDGIAGRLAQLQRAQDQLADELESLLGDLAAPLRGFARYAEPAAD